MATPSTSCTIVGSEKGTLKEADWSGGKFTNLSNLDLDWAKRVVHLSWDNADETEVLIGRSSGVVETFSLANSEVLRQGICAGTSETATLQGIGRLDRSCVSGFSDGSVSCWRWNDQQQCEVVSSASVGSSLSCIYSDFSQRHEVATGGKKNNLKLWDAERLDKPVFTAKNLPNDTLDLEVPVWVESITYPDPSLIAVGTAYHEIQLYDPRSKRRPVTRYDWGEHPILCMDTVPDKRQLIVANTQGDLALLELDTGNLLGQFRGVCGSIRHVQCHKTQPLVLSCSLDRYIRLHHTVTRRLVKEVFVKQRMSSGLLPSSEVMSLAASLKRPRPAAATTADIAEGGSDDDDDEDVWDALNLASEENSAAAEAAAAAAAAAAGETMMDTAEAEVIPDVVPAVSAEGTTASKKRKKKTKTSR